MADQGSRERELRKNTFRRNMTVNREPEEETQQEPEKGKGRWRIGLILLAVFVLLTVFLVYRWEKENGTWKNVKEVWAVSLPDTNFSQFIGTETGVLRCSRDGAALYDKNGDMVWNQSFEMTNPIVAVNGSRLAIADQKGFTLYLFDEHGLTGSAQTNLPISRVAAAGNGVAAVILEDTSANYISLFAQDGTALDIEVKTILAGDGYPIDLSLSEDGTILMASFAYLNQGMMQNKVVFYNFSEAGKNMVQRIVGGFQQYESALVPDVEMLGQKAAVAFADDRISFYSLKNEVSPELVAEITAQQEIRSVFVSDTHVGVVFASGENVRQKELVVYDSRGREVFRRTTELDYRQAAFTGDHVVLYHETECEIYSLRGNLRYAGALSGTITYLSCPGGTWIQIGGQEMKKLNFQ